MLLGSVNVACTIALVALKFQIVLKSLGSESLKYSGFCTTDLNDTYKV